MYALGRLHNAISSPTTTAKYTSMQDAATLTIYAVGASGATNLTVTVAKDAAGTSPLNYDGAAGHGDGITLYWQQVGSTGLWTSTAQAAANTAPTTSGTGDILVVEINEEQLPDGYKYVAASHASATCVMVLADLEVKRRPSNLRSPIV
jgi:hypothetical protein